MTQGLTLQFRQSQTLVVTPQLMQAIRMLQMGHGELERHVEAQLESNPLLMRRENRAREVRAGAQAGPAPRAEAPDPAAWAATEPSLTAHLESMIDASFADLRERFLARVLLAHVDECGYLTAGLDAVAAEAGASVAEMESVLARCQGLEPTGVFSRSLAECLALQLAERDRLDPAMRALLDNLELLAARDFSGLRRRCGVDEDDLAEMIAEIRACDPKPGLRFRPEAIRVVQPDVFVRRAPQGGWTVELNEAVLPRIRVDGRCHARLCASRDPEGRAFAAERFREANWLMKSLEQRARTILKVAGEIVRRQDAFLTHGVAHLRPLNLRAVADAIGVHESTVSRAAAAKYISTPRGLFEMKFFFSTALAGADGGEAHSAEAVKHRIRRLIDNESPDAVLSDDALVALLRRDGIEIARRTVAKYREMLRIGSSVQRRREKRGRIAS